ncbi:MAG: transporter substrate-binding domain-containing protein [Thiolinea sp.]
MSNKFLLAMALGTALALSGTAAMADTFRVGTEGAYAPYNFMNDEGKLAGFEIDLGNELCKRMDMECEFIVNEWDSIIPNLVAGNYDAIMAGMSITDERKKTIAFSDEYKPVDPSLYLAAAGTELDFDNLEGKSIGVQGATIQAAFAEEKFAGKNTIKSYEKPDQSIADLGAGNVDAVLADGEFIRTMEQGAQGAFAIIGPEEMIGGGIGIGMRQDDAGLQEKVNAALEAVKQDGTLDELIMKYFEVGPFYKSE